MASTSNSAPKAQTTSPVLTFSGGPSDRRRKALLFLGLRAAALEGFTLGRGSGFEGSLHQLAQRLGIDPELADLDLASIVEQGFVRTLDLGAGNGPRLHLTDAGLALARALLLDAPQGSEVAA